MTTLLRTCLGTQIKSLINVWKTIIEKHGERCDQVYGAEEWMQRCFDKHGNYSRFDLNLPKQLPERDDWRDYKKDAPLTRIGAYQATLTGEALSESGIQFAHVYCSPSFRCIETATYVLKGIGIQKEVTINIEPGLFEWLGETYKSGAPKWMNASQLKAYGYNVNLDYKPFMDVSKLLKCMGEDCVQWYNRSFEVTTNILKSLKSKGNVLFVAHGGSMDPLTRQLTGKAANSDGDFADLTPFCGVLRVTKDSNGLHHIVESGIHGFKHMSNFVYEWQKLLNDVK